MLLLLNNFVEGIKKEKEAQQEPFFAAVSAMVDLGLGVSVAAEVDAAQPLLVDVGAGVHLAMAPREALLAAVATSAAAEPPAAATSAGAPSSSGAPRASDEYACTAMPRALHAATTSRAGSRGCSSTWLTCGSSRTHGASNSDRCRGV
jgi:hypothetical protein